MKKNIHPKYGPVQVVLVSGESVTLYSTYNKDRIVLEIDPFTHSAWKTEADTSVSTIGKSAKFAGKFGSIDLNKVKKAN